MTSQPQHGECGRTFLFLGIELILDPQAVGDGAAILIEARFESGNTAAEIISGGMAVVGGDVLPKPPPERLDWHEVGAVARQGHELDPQHGRRLADDAGAMIGSAVPHDRQPPVGPFGPQPAQNIDGVFAVGAGIGPEPHLALVVKIEAVEGELVRQPWRVRGDPEAAAPL